MRTSSCVAWLFDAVVHKDIVLLALTEHRPVQATLQNIGHTGHLTEHRPPYRTQARTGHLTEHRPVQAPVFRWLQSVPSPLDAATFHTPLQGTSNI